VHLVGAWKGKLDIKELAPGNVQREGSDSSPVHARIEACQFVETSFTTEKWRVYEYCTDGTRLKQRYDRDLAVGDHRNRGLKDPWPADVEFSAVIVADYNKGFLDLPSVQKELKKYRDSLVLLRLKRTSTVLNHYREFKKAWLLPNREELLKLSNAMHSPSPVYIKEVHGTYALHPDLIDALVRLEKLFGRTIVVKLDREGVVLLHEGKVTMLALASSNAGNWAGLGAGDTLTASLAVELPKILGTSRRDTIAEVCRAAVKRATAQHRAGADVARMEHPYAVSTVRMSELEDIHVVLEPLGPLKKLENGHRAATDHNQVLGQKEPRLSIHNGNWYLDGFLTVDRKLGRKITDLQSQIKAYFQFGDAATRPFVAAICGEPGSGKSKLVQALGKALDCEVLGINAAQWRSPDELFDVCERVRTVQLRHSHPLVFIDEVDCIDELYGKLLAPVGDGAYFVQTEKREIGAVVFLLAGSTDAWQSEKKLRDPKLLRRSKKLSDLVSRLNCVLDLPPLDSRKSDAVYIAADCIRRRFPAVRTIQEGVLRFVVERKALHGPRSVALLVDRLPPLEQASVVTTRDWNGLRADQLKLHFKKRSHPRPEEWLNKDKPVAVEP
jgi:hypothetical protein